MSAPATFFSIPAVWHNILVTLLTALYVFSVPPAMNFLVSNREITVETSRKITHIFAGSVIFFLPLYVDGDWSQFLNVTVFAIWTILLMYKGLLADDDDVAVKTMTRTGRKSELLKGTLYFVLVGILCGTFYYKQPAGVLAMAILGWGDGVAPLIGVRYGHHRYHIFADKSLEGSLAFFVAAVGAGILSVHLIVPGYHIGKVIIIALAATVVEAASPRDIDNLTVPLGVIAMSWLL